MKLPPFELTRAESLGHAVEVLGELGPDAKILAGGQSLLPLMSFRLAAPEHLVDVGELRELAFVRDGVEGLEVGGTTRHVDLERESARLGAHWQALRDALPLVGHLPIRSRGTLGGSVAHADPTAELPLLVRTFDAVITAQSRRGRREIPAAEFFTGVLSTDLAHDEMLVSIRFPAPPVGAVSAFTEFSERAGDFALASACVAVASDDVGVCRWVRVGLGSVAPSPIRATGVEARLQGSRLDGAAIDEACAALREEIRPRDTLHTSADYRRELAAEMLRRALGRVARELALRGAG